MSLRARMRSLRRTSVGVVALGLVTTVVAAVVVSSVIVAEIRNTEAEIERVSDAAERRGFAIRHIERVEEAAVELERAVLDGMLEPDDTRSALEVERLAHSFETQAQRASELLPTGDPSCVSSKAPANPWRQACPTTSANAWPYR
jgi:hypothetical protein